MATPPLLECVAAWLRGCVAAWLRGCVAWEEYTLTRPLWTATGQSCALECHWSVARRSATEVRKRLVCMSNLSTRKSIELGLRRAVVAGPAPAPPPVRLPRLLTDNAGDYAPAPESGHKDRSTSFCTDAPEPNRVQKLHTHEARHSCEHFQNHVPSQHSAHRSCRARVQSSCYPISGPKMPPYRSYTAELYVYPE